jgi:hypothetical protein
MVIFLFFFQCPPTCTKAYCTACPERVDASVSCAILLSASFQVTLYGAGFHGFGAGLLCCVLGTSGTCAATATLLDVKDGLSRALCTLPAAGKAGDVPIEISLNGGLAGSVSSGAAAANSYAFIVILSMCVCMCVCMYVRTYVLLLVSI